MLELYRILQEDVEDTDVRLIFKWWLPQAVETLAILASAKATEFDVTKAVFEETSAHAIYLLFGEYLVLEQSLPSTNSKPIQEEGVQLGQQYKEHTALIRSLVNNTYHAQAQTKTAGATDTYSNSELDRSKVITRDDSDVALKRTHSNTWSHTSTGDQSPREEVDTFLNEDTVIVGLSHSQLSSSNLGVIGVPTCHIHEPDASVSLPIALFCYISHSTASSKEYPGTCEFWKNLS